MYFKTTGTCRYSKLPLFPRPGRTSGDVCFECKGGIINEYILVLSFADHLLTSWEIQANQRIEQKRNRQNVLIEPIYKADFK